MQVINDNGNCLPMIHKIADVAQNATYATGGGLIGAGAMSQLFSNVTIGDWGIIVGITLGILTYLTNTILKIYYQEKSLDLERRKLRSRSDD